VGFSCFCKPSNQAFSYQNPNQARLTQFLVSCAARFLHTHEVQLLTPNSTVPEPRLSGDGLATAVHPAWRFVWGAASSDGGPWQVSAGEPARLLVPARDRVWGPLGEMAAAMTRRQRRGWPTPDWWRAAVGAWSVPPQSCSPPPPTCFSPYLLFVFLAHAR